ncbi:MAG: hypothetical protein ABFD50_21985 [Smithella sp.]
MAEGSKNNPENRNKEVVKEKWFKLIGWGKTKMCKFWPKDPEDKNCKVGDLIDKRGNVLIPNYTLS